MRFLKNIYDKFYYNRFLNCNGVLMETQQITFDHHLSYLRLLLESTSNSFMITLSSKIPSKAGAGGPGGGGCACKF